MALDETLASAWMGLADVYIRRGDYDRAMEVLQEGLEKTGSDQTIADKIAEIEAGQIKDSSGKIRRRNGYVKGEFAWYHIFDYNEAGKQKSVTAYDAEGNQVSYFELQYDEESRALNSYSWLFETGKIDGYHELEYDSNGNKVKSMYYKMDGHLAYYTLYQYDSNGTLMSDEEYNAGTDQIYNRTEYDEQGNSIKTVYYKPDGSISGYYIYEYNEEGKRTGSKSYDATGNLREYNIIRFDDNGKSIGQEYYDANGNLKYSTVFES